MTKLPATQPVRSNTPRHWKVHVEALQKSGLSRAEYCRQHKLSYHTLTYWLRKLPAKTTSNEPSLVPVPFKSFIKHNSVVQERAALRLILSEGRVVEVGDDFSSATLTRLLAALERR